MWKKLKTLTEDTFIYLCFLIILVALASFGLGRLSATSPSVLSAMAQPKATVTLSDAPMMKPMATTTKETSDAVGVIASKNGTKYHLPSCPGAKQISEKNKISFSSEEAAKASGYSPAANCKF